MSLYIHTHIHTQSPDIKCDKYLHNFHVQPANEQKTMEGYIFIYKKSKIATTTNQPTKQG